MTYWRKLLVDGPGTQANVSNNQISGDGAITTIAQNGIQVSRGATGVVSGNRVFDNTYTGAGGGGPGQGSGILPFCRPFAGFSGTTSICTGQPSGDLLVTGNTVERNDTNINLFQTDSIRITSNSANRATFFDGLFADPDSTGNLFQGNTASNNGNGDPANGDNGGHDCHDDSVGLSTAGTANNWVNDQGVKAMPGGICQPTVQQSQSTQAERDAQRQVSASPVF